MSKKKHNANARKASMEWQANREAKEREKDSFWGPDKRSSRAAAERESKLELQLEVRNLRDAINALNLEIEKRKRLEDKLRREANEHWDELTEYKVALAQERLITRNTIAAKLLVENENKVLREGLPKRRKVRKKREKLHIYEQNGEKYTKNRVKVVKTRKPANTGPIVTIPLN